MSSKSSPSIIDFNYIFLPMLLSIFMLAGWYDCKANLLISLGGITLFGNTFYLFVHSKRIYKELKNKIHQTPYKYYDRDTKDDNIIFTFFINISSLIIITSASKKLTLIVFKFLTGYIMPLMVVEYIYFPFNILMLIYVARKSISIAKLCNKCLISSCIIR